MIGKLIPVDTDKYTREVYEGRLVSQGGSLLRDVNRPARPPSGANSAWAVDAPAARAGMRAVPVRFLGMAGFGRFWPILAGFFQSGRFGWFGMLRGAVPRGRKTDWQSVLPRDRARARVRAAYAAFSPSRRGQREAGVGIAGLPAIAFRGAASIVRTVVSLGTPIAKLCAPCRAPSRPPRPLAAPAPWIA